MPLYVVTIHSPPMREEIALVADDEVQAKEKAASVAIHNQLKKAVVTTQEAAGPEVP